MKTTALLAATAAALAGLASPVSAGDCEGELSFVCLYCNLFVFLRIWFETQCRWVDCRVRLLPGKEGQEMMLRWRQDARQKRAPDGADGWK